MNHLGLARLSIMVGVLLTGVLTGVLAGWILRSGTWDDDGVWGDTENWVD